MKKVIKVKLNQEQSIMLMAALGLPEAFNIIFRCGTKPKEEDFSEFTDFQYRAFEKKMRPLRENEQLFGWFVAEHSYVNREIQTVSCLEKSSLLIAASEIERLAHSSGRQFKNYKDKLSYVASLLPPEYSENTRFAQKRLRPVPDA